MRMGQKVSIEVDLGLKAVEKVDVNVYVDGELVENHWDVSYDDLPMIASELRSRYRDAEVETWCSGLDCAMKNHRWQIEL